MMNLDTAASIVLVVAVVLFAVLRLLSARQYKPSAAGYTQYGEITLETLEMYSGFDPFRPLLLAVQGRVYNVSEGYEFYGKGDAHHPTCHFSYGTHPYVLQGGSYAAMTGKECARALAKMSLNGEDFNDDLSDCTDVELKALHDWIVKFNDKYPVVGKIIPSKQITLDELHLYDGSDPSKPMYLAISGVIFDVSSASDFYGPDGIYPFAGHECARAFALVSVDVNDCIANLDGLTKGDLDTLKEWEMKFRSKYNIIGRIIDP